MGFTQWISGSDKAKQPFKLPLIKLNRGAPSAYDALWIMPIMFHMMDGLWCGRTFVNWALGIELGGLSRASLALMWGWISQFTFNAVFGGDAFSIPVNISKTENGFNRVPKILMQCVAPFALYLIFTMVFGQQWIQDSAVNNLPKIPMCGSGTEAACKVSYCGFLEAWEGTCSTGRAKGCCMTAGDILIDEIRHSFLFNYLMKLFNPWMGLTVPFWAATFQAAIRLMPSAQLGLIANPNTHILRAVLSGDYSTVTYVVAAITIAQFLSTYAVSLTWQVVSLHKVLLAGKTTESEGETEAKADMSKSMLGRDKSVLPAGKKTKKKAE